LPNFSPFDISTLFESKTRKTISVDSLKAPSSVLYASENPSIRYLIRLCRLHVCSAYSFWSRSGSSRPKLRLAKVSSGDAIAGLSVRRRGRRYSALALPPLKMTGASSVIGFSS
jgi:hypothetical protein